MSNAFDDQPTVPSPVGAEPAEAAAPSRRWLLLHKVRLALAILATVSLLPYSWAYTLVVYSRWHQVDRRFAVQLLAGIVGVIVLNFNVAAKFRSPRFGFRVLAVVFLLWTAVAAALIVFRNGSMLPDWIVFAGFFPATLWVVWTAWMFFVRMRWYTRLGVFAVLIAAVAPFLLLFEIKDLTGAANVNFAFRARNRPLPVEVSSTVGELKGPGIKLVANSHADFPGFQGPDRTAVLPDARLDPDWNAHPPQLMWRVPIGSGWSGFAVVGEYAFTQEQRGDEECVVCRELSSGREVWVHKDKAPYNGQPRYEGMGGPGPRATPTIEAGRVYTVGATGILNCLDGGNGHAVWTVNIVKDNHGSVAGHGVCGSPLIVGDTVVVAPTGNREASLAAYDREKGTRRWACGQDSAGYATPLLASIGSDASRQILNYTSKGIAAHDPVSGKLLWHFNWTNDQSVICSEPVPRAGAPDQVLLTTGYGGGSVLLKVACATDRKWSAEPVWHGLNLKTKFATAVVRDGYAYGLDDGILQCVDLANGKQKWKRGRYEYGQILLADDLILVQTEGGPVALVEANPEKFVELGKIPALSSKTWNCPALAGKYLLVRNDKEAAGYEVPLRSR